jgi:hypothetical protein
MLESIKTPFPECVQILCDKIKLDPHFAEFYEWTLQSNIPVVVLSSGIDEIIRALLTKLVGPTADKIVIVSNKKRELSDGKWEIVFHDARFVLMLRQFLMQTVTSGMTSHWKFGLINSSRPTCGQLCFTQEMEFLIYRLRVRPTYFLPKKAMVSHAESKATPLNCQIL